MHGGDGGKNARNCDLVSHMITSLSKQPLCDVDGDAYEIGGEGREVTFSSSRSCGDGGAVPE